MLSGAIDASNTWYARHTVTTAKTVKTAKIITTK
jgi:hypothetical protein